MSLSVTQDLDVNVEAPPVYYMGDNLQKEIRKYKYLTDKEGRDKAEVLKCNETLSEFENTLIVRNELTNSFLVYNSIGQYLKTPLPHAHEVIMGDRGQKLKFDIDACSEKIVDFPEDTRVVGSAEYRKRIWLFGTIVDNILRTFKFLYGRNLYPDMLIITDQSDDTKFSRHIIIDLYYVYNNREADHFTKTLAEFISKVDNRIIERKILDLGINKSLQSFRIINCTKVGSDRVKRLITTNYIPKDTFITDVAHCIPLDAKVVEEPINIEYITSVEDTEILQLAASYTTGHIFRERKGNIFLFNRIEPTLCSICNRTHTNDNTAMVFISLNGSIYYRCRKGSQNILLERKKKLAVDFFQYIKSINIKSTRDDFYPLGAHVIKCNSENLPDLNIDDSDITIVKSGMGTGKTLATARVVIEMLKRSPNMRIIIVSCRQTLTTKFASLFKDFIDYRNIKGPITQDKVIIQYESLHRLEVQPNKECLFIIDESQSVIGQDQHKPSGIENGNKTTRIFKWLMFYATKVLMLDANANYRTYNVAAMTERKIQVIHNKFTRPFNDYYYKKEDEFLNQLLIAASTYKQIPFACACNSKRRLEYYKRIITEKYPSARIKFYTGDSSETEKNADLSDVDNAWKDIDIIFYTSTISQGISYEGDRFKKVYAYFTDRSTDYETSIQMLGRFRQCNEFHICIKSSPAGLPSTWDDLNNILLDEAGVAKLEHMRIKPYICNGGKIIMPNGRLDFEHKDFQYIMALGNLRHNIQSRNAYFRMFVELRMRMGGIMNVCNVGKFMGDFEKIKANESRIMREIKIDEANTIVDAYNIDDERLGELQAANIMTVADSKAMHKKNLADFYGIFVEAINEHFVLQYDKPAVKRRFKISNETLGCDNIEFVSEHCWSHDNELFRGNKDKAAGCFAIQILRQLDKDYKPGERKAINRLDLETKLPEIMQLIERVNKYISVAFEIKLSSLKNLFKRDFQEKLKCVNSILNIAFGISIKMSGKSKAASRIFFITPCKDFTWNPDAQIFKVC